MNSLSVILLLIVIILFILFLYIYITNNNTTKSKYICIFLEKQEAFNELFDNSLEPFLQDDNITQLQLKLNNNTINDHNRNDLVQKIYKQHILDFTDDEKNILDEYVKYIHHQTPKIKWVFIKLSDAITNNLPYTRNRAIILFPSFIQSLYTTNNNRFNRRLLETLIHEHIHVYQRYNRSLFERYYNDLGFMKVNITLPHNTQIVSNPDGLDYWVFKIKNNYILPVLINSDTNSFKGYNFKYSYYMLDSNMNYRDYTLYNLKELKEYTDIYCNNPYIHNIYHPNEISSDMITYIVSTIIYNEKRDECFNKIYNHLHYYNII
jgi:hypothetical protein